MGRSKEQYEHNDTKYVKIANKTYIRDTYKIINSSDGITRRSFVFRRANKEPIKPEDMFQLEQIIAILENDTDYIHFPKQLKKQILKNQERYEKGKTHQ